MTKHQEVMTLLYKGENFVEYAHSVSNELEAAYQMYKMGQGSDACDVDLNNRISTTGTEQKANNAHTGCLFEVHFQNMSQVNKNSKFKRNVKRVEVERAVLPEIQEDFAIELDPKQVVNTGDVPPLPADVDFVGTSKNEPERILSAMPGQIIQVSRTHEDNVWL